MTFLFPKKCIKTFAIGRSIIKSQSRLPYLMLIVAVTGRAEPFMTAVA